MTVPLWQWLSTRGYFDPPRDIWQCLEIFFIVTAGGGVLAPSGWTLEMLLNILQ